MPIYIALYGLADRMPAVPDKPGKIAKRSRQIEYVPDPPALSEMKSHCLTCVQCRNMVVGVDTRPCSIVLATSQNAAGFSPDYTCVDGSSNIQSQPRGRMNGRPGVIDRITGMQAIMKQGVRLNSKRCCARVFRDGRWNDLGRGGVYASLRQRRKRTSGMPITSYLGAYHALP
jgi:hypothetical protein